MALIPSTQTSAPQAISPMMGNVQLRFVQHSCIFNLVRQYQTLMAKDPGTPLQLTLCAENEKPRVRRHKINRRKHCPFQMKNSGAFPLLWL